MFGAMMGPRTELYVKLACAYHRPEYYAVLPPPSPIFMNVTSSSHFLDVRFPAAEIWLPRAQDVRPIPAVNIPSGNTKCSSDPVVLAAVAKLVTGTKVAVGNTENTRRFSDHLCSDYARCGYLDLYYDWLVGTGMLRRSSYASSSLIVRDV